MTNDAIINHKKVTLTLEEVEGASKFHKSRIPFFMDHHGYLIFNENPEDDRDHQHWMMEDHNYTLEEWESTPRGYFMEGRIQLFRGSSFSPVDISIVANCYVALVTKYRSIFGDCPDVICNGVVVGKVGEVWKPAIMYNRTYIASLAGAME